MGSYPPNPLGLYDMHGNVQQWCDDRPANGNGNRVVRAGAYNSVADHCRAGVRWLLPPSHRNRNCGLRVARVPVGKEIVETPPGEKNPASLAPVPPAVGPKPDVAPTTRKISRRPFLVRGNWKIEHDELIQPDLTSGEESPSLVFGESTLSNYDLTLQIKKLAGAAHWGFTSTDSDRCICASSRSQGTADSILPMSITGSGVVKRVAGSRYASHRTSGIP